MSNKNKPGKNKAAKAGIDKAKQEKRNLWLGFAGIAVLTLLVYLPVFANSLVNLDDDYYIEDQHLIRVFDIKALFSQFVMGNYHPLVMLAYTIIYHFYKLSPQAYHSVSLLLHIINTGLVLWLMYSLTRSFPVSIIVALLFSIHPLHVESVAWASELKDLMYTFGFLASLILYVRYVRENQPARLYIFSLLLFLFSLLSKGMGVSLTLVLFLVDFYLGRKFTTKTIVEKIPFILLSVVFSIVAIYAQKSIGALSDTIYFTFPQRVVYACYGFIIYIVRIFVPLNLSPYYPYPVKSGNPVPSLYYIYPLLVILLFSVAVYSLRKTKKLFLGIGFFAATVVLVLQLIPVGGAITADRYTYIPSIGIFFLLAEGLLYLSKRISPTSSFSPMVMGVVAVFVVFFSIKTYSQVNTWKDGMTLWTGVIDHYQTVSIAYDNRGELYGKAGDFDKAIADFNLSLALNPTDANTWSNLGLAYQQLGAKDSVRVKEYYAKSLGYFNKAIELKPDFATAYGDRGIIFISTGHMQEALSDFSKSIELNPYFVESYYNRAIINYRLGKTAEACPDFKRAAELGYQPAIEAYRDICK